MSDINLRLETGIEACADDDDDGTFFTGGFLKGIRSTHIDIPVDDNSVWDCSDSADWEENF